MCLQVWHVSSLADFYAALDTTQIFGLVFCHLYLDVAGVWHSGPVILLACGFPWFHEIQGLVDFTKHQVP